MMNKTGVENERAKRNRIKRGKWRTRGEKKDMDGNDNWGL